MPKLSARISPPFRRLPLLPLLWALALAGHVPSTGADVVGVPWTGEAGVTETVATINARSAQKAKEGKPVARIHQRLRPNRHGLPQHPQSPQAPLVANTPLTPSTPGPLAPQTVGTNFLGPTLADTGYLFPPDSMGAVGPSQFIVAVNGRFRSYNKATGAADGYLDADPDVFWASVMTPPTTGATATSTTDPRIRYDRLSGRWFITMVDTPYNTAVANRVMIAVSSGATITSSSSFKLFQFQNSAVLPTGNTSYFADYPSLGIDNNALYIGVNMFNSSGTFKGTTGFVVRKSTTLGTGPIVVTAFRGLVPIGSPTAEGPYSPQGVDNYDPAATEGYFIGASNIGNTYLVLRRISTPGGSPTISANITITVPATEYPITVPHKGNTVSSSYYGELDALDDRLFAAHLRNGRLWTAHNIEVNTSGVATVGGGRDGSRWYEIQNLTGTPSVVQSGTVFDSTATASNPKSYWIPSLMISGQGHVAMGFSTAGTANYINAGTCGRLAGDALGTMRTPVVEYTASATAYNPSGDTGSSTGRRWGDYSYTSLDPNDDMTMWTIQEYCNAKNSYGLQIAKLLAPPPATPASCSPASIVTGQTSVSVTLTGTQVSGSGFYDPGSGFANRFAAAVSGGVTVASVTYNNPTSVTLVLNTAAASTGAKTITVTNPDGQALTSASGILTVVTPIQSWRQLHFNTTLNTGTAADTADPNNNGIVNLTEYALGGDPAGTTTGTTILPAPGRSATQHLQILFTRYTDRTDLILTVQATDSLTSPWTDLAQSTSGAAFVSLVTGVTATETGTGTTRAVTVTDLYQVTDPSHPHRFMRLKIASTD